MFAHNGRIKDKNGVNGVYNGTLGTHHRDHRKFIAYVENSRMPAN